jgi:transposase InsO family protein
MGNWVSWASPCQTGPCRDSCDDAVVHPPRHGERSWPITQPSLDGLLHCADTHRPRAVRARNAHPPPPPNRHLAVTEHRTAAWTAQQIIEAFPNDIALRWLLRDRDAIYGDVFRRRVAGMGITEVITSPSSPWQNPYAERLIGSIRRECLDHVIVLGERHLRRLLTAYLAYYHGARRHLALEKNAPTTRRVQTPTEGPVVALPEVGGLHHRYERRAA